MDNQGATSTNATLDRTKQIVAAYVGHNAMSVGDLPGFIGQVHSALMALTTPSAPELPLQVPAVPIKRSVRADHIVCLEDGKQFKTLKRHLRTEHDLTPEAYRTKWNLPSDYPFVAPEYSKTRSTLAHQIGLGVKRKPRARKGRPKA